MPLSKARLLLIFMAVAISSHNTATAKCFSCVEGRSAYEQIQAQIGPGAIQTPDYVYHRSPCHPGVEHITCENTTTHPDQVFKFIVHLEEDCEPVKSLWDRQRVEILVGYGQKSLLGGFGLSGFDYFDLQQWFEVICLWILSLMFLLAVFWHLFVI